jgi:thiamine-monophosphate kinase
MTGEDAIVGALMRRFAAGTPGVILGIGDDAAVLRPKGAAEDLVITTDMLIEDVDFRRSWMPPRDLGHKALAVNLSDLAAMGSRPLYYLVALALPDGVDSGWIRSFYSGMKRLSDRLGVGLVGGDLSRSPAGIQVTVVAVGQTIGRKPVTRRGGRPGDVLFATGVLGKAAAGLRLLEEGVSSGRNRAEREAISAHRRPVPRCEVGIWLGKHNVVSCMMDLSDGISADLPRLCATSHTGAVVEAARLPLFQPSSRWGCDPASLALHGGEDFELLFAVPRRKVAHLQRAWPPGFPPASAIGSLVPGRRVAWLPRPGASPESLPRLGFDHFTRGRD